MTLTAGEPPAQSRQSKAANPVKANTRSQPPPRKHIAQLIGKRRMGSCAINGVPLQMLLDSGAQVSMVQSAYIGSRGGSRGGPLWPPDRESASITQ